MASHCATTGIRGVFLLLLNTSSNIALLKNDITDPGISSVGKFVCDPVHLSNMNLAWQGFGTCLLIFCFGFKNNFC